MKYSLLLLLAGLVANSAFAYQSTAVNAALESHFDSAVEYWALEYSDSTSQECDLMASVLARRAASRSSAAYECQVCLIADDNLFWDYNDVSCDLAWD